MRFLTKESLKSPPTAEVKALMPKELARAKELIEQGLIEAVYIAADRSGAWLIWNCESQAVLEETHKTLPLHEYLTSETTVLSEEM